MSDLAALRTIAQEASQEPWEDVGSGGMVVRAHARTIVANVSVLADARFIAACDPPTILALLDRIENLEKENP